MHTGDIIKKLRNEKKITQGELGVMLGVNTSSIQKYESGATKNLKLETIRELCHIFEVPAAYFVFPEILNMSYKQFEKEFGTMNTMLRDVLDLNDQGVKKLIEYIEDITSMDKYKKSR